MVTYIDDGEFYAVNFSAAKIVILHKLFLEREHAAIELIHMHERIKKRKVLEERRSQTEHSTSSVPQTTLTNRTRLNFACTTARPALSPPSGLILRGALAM